MSRLMVIGCGGVASVAVHKCCQNSGVFTELMIASRTKSKCDALKAQLEGKTDTVITTAQVDADKVEELEALIRSYKPDAVLNVALPYQDLTIMEACLRTGVDYIDTANANTMVISHCETKACVENIDEVLKVDGVDVIFIGPMDLSQSYGVPGKPDDPEVQAAIEMVTKKTLAAGKAVGTVAGTPEAAKELIEKGVQYILLASDQGMIVKWGKNAIGEIRG